MSDNIKYICDIRGNIKKGEKVLVGDYVEIEENKYNKNKKIITKLHNRTNCLVRPPIANLEKLFILISPKPEPDLILVDKLLIYAIQNDLIPYIVINKSDMAETEFVENLINQYTSVVEKIIVVSAKEQRNLEELREELKDSFSAFAGQSAVGKSTLLNNLFEGLNLRTNDLSKIERGKHTTRQCEIFSFEDGIRIADTVGFSMLDLKEIEPLELHTYYIEFDNYAENCKFKNCTHINETIKSCGVIKALNDNLLNKERFERYVNIYAELKEVWERKYD